MKIDLLASPNNTADIPTAKDNKVATTSGHSAKAIVLHGVARLGPMAAKIREVERAFRKKGGGVIGCRWLLQWNRRKRKTSSSMVVFLWRAVPTAIDMWVRMRDRKHTVEKYNWGMKGSDPVGGW